MLVRRRWAKVIEVAVSGFWVIVNQSTLNVNIIEKGEM